MKKLSFKHTQAACCLAYISQAIAATFLPLLFVHFQGEFGLSLARLTALITVTFFTEIVIDALSPVIIKKIGYRKAMIAANILSAAGFVGLAVFPSVFGTPFAGLLAGTVLYAIGGGFDEVLVSPIVEACPTENKAGAMGLVHSAFCIGCAFVVLASTAYFRLFGIESWRILSCLWAVIPAVNSIYFIFVPIRTLEEEKGEGRFSDMLKNPLFWVLGAAMVCAGASELSMSQWASAFAESGLGVSKTAGDLLGPFAFAVLMGISRLVYSKFGDDGKIIKIMTAGSVLAAVSYLVAALSGNSVISLLGCCVCGIAVAPMWPGAFSLAAKHIPNASTAMFAAFALLGDFGCTAGPSAVGAVSQANNNEISAGLLSAAVFPLIMLVCLVLVSSLTKKRKR